MMFKTHLAFSLLLGLVFLDIIGRNKIIFLALVLLSSSIVDIDTPKSKVGRRVWIFSRILNFLFGHRQLFHSLFAAAVLSFIFWTFFGELSLAVFLGYTSHIFLDGFTIDGVNFIYPFKQLKLSGFIETGKKKDCVLFYVFCVLDLFLLIERFFNVM